MMRTSPDLVRHSGALQRRPGANGRSHYDIGGTRGACPVQGAAVGARLAPGMRHVCHRCRNANDR